LRYPRVDRPVTFDVEDILDSRAAIVGALRTMIHDQGGR
jgi:hypothetical protein